MYVFGLIVIIGQTLAQTSSREFFNVYKSMLALNAVDSDIYWPGIIYINDTFGANIIRLFEDNYICCYPRPIRVVHDNRTDFTGW